MLAPAAYRWLSGPHCSLPRYNPSFEGHCPIRWSLARRFVREIRDLVASVPDDVAMIIVDHVLPSPRRRPLSRHDPTDDWFRGEFYCYGHAEQARWQARFYARLHRS